MPNSATLQQLQFGSTLLAIAGYVGARMKIFLLVLIVAALVGGFGVGQFTGNMFSILGAAAGGVGTAALLLGLGAYFDHQDRKKPQRDTSLDHVFDSMITGKNKPTRKEVEDTKKRMQKTGKKR